MTSEAGGSSPGVATGSRCRREKKKKKEKKRTAHRRRDVHDLVEGAHKKKKKGSDGPLGCQTEEKGGKGEKKKKAGRSSPRPIRFSEQPPAEWKGGGKKEKNWYCS